MTDRKPKRIEVYSYADYDDDFPPTNLSDFVVWATEQMNKVPAEFRSTATINIDTTVYYDVGQVTIDIDYERPETDEETAERCNREYDRRELIERRERKELAKLVGEIRWLT